MRRYYRIQKALNAADASTSTDASTRKGAADLKAMKPEDGDATSCRFYRRSIRAYLEWISSNESEVKAETEAGFAGKLIKLSNKLRDLCF